jgi:hypothetical protein
MKRMSSNFLVAATLAIVAACAQQTVHGQEPPINVNPNLHGNIARAQELTRQAFDSMTAAQQANEYDMGGHAARAKELLRQASEEMKLAAVAANRR